MTETRTQYTTNRVIAAVPLIVNPIQVELARSTVIDTALRWAQASRAADQSPEATGDLWTAEALLQSAVDAYEALLPAGE